LNDALFMVAKLAYEKKNASWHETSVLDEFQTLSLVFRAKRSSHPLPRCSRSRALSHRGFAVSIERLCSWLCRQFLRAEISSRPDVCLSSIARTLAKATTSRFPAHDLLAVLADGQFPALCSRVVATAHTRPSECLRDRCRLFCG